MKISLLWWIMFGQEGSFCLGHPCGQQMSQKNVCVCVSICTLLSCEQRSSVSQLALTVRCMHFSPTACLLSLLQMMPWIQLVHMSDMNNTLDEIHSQTLGEKAEIFKRGKGNVSVFPNAALISLRAPLLTPNARRTGTTLCEGSR